MTFISFADQWQVLIDDQGNPLIGRLQFLDYATSEPKNVYEDINLSTVAENPQYTDITGKLEHQIFLGTGDYKVRFERYIGTGNMKDPDQADDDSLWNAFKTEVISGLATSDSILGENVLIINTIAELRSVDTENYTTVTVLGYYSRFDNIAPRTYVWSENDTRVDNFGSIIQRTGQNTGRWNMLEPEEMDSRYFGIFPSLTTTYNSQLTALISWLTSQYCTCKSIRFSTGTYSFVTGTFTFLKKLILEPDVKFAIIGSSTLNININGNYDIQSVNPLIANTAALDNVIISFNGSKNAINRVVKSEWYGNWSDSTNGDSASLIAMSSRVGKHYLIQFGTTYYMTSGKATFYQDIEFINGSIAAKGGEVIFSNNKVTSPEVIAVRLTTATGGNYNAFSFTSGAEVRSSLFDSTAFQTTLAGIQTNSTEANFIFDSDVAFTGVFTDNDGFTYFHEKGIISTQTADAYAKFNTFILPSRQVFGYNSWIGLKNQDTKIIYFLPSDPTQTEQENAFYSTLRCALHGNGVADMCGINPEINAVSTDTRLTSEDNIDILEIRNSTVTVTAAITLIDVYCSIFQVRLKDFYMYDPATAGSTLISCGSGGSISTLIFDNVTIVNSNGAGEAIKTVDGGTISNVEVTNSHIRNGWLINEVTVSDYGVQQVNIHNNKNLWCGFRARNAKPIISENYIQGNTAAKYWEVKANYSAIISNNRFYECDLYLLDNGGRIDHVVTGNQFESSNAKWSRIIIKAETANTIISGLIANENSFIGNVDTQFVAISCEGSYSSDWVYETTQLTSASSEIFNAYSSIHKAIVKNNSSSNRYIIVPSTEGIFAQSFVLFEAALDDYDIRTFTKAIPFDNQVFYIPGATHNFQTDLSVIGKYGNNSNEFASQLNYMKYIPAGSFGDYRTDSNYTVKIYCPDSATPLLYCTVKFRIYDSQIVSWLV
jgi:hypothetical protein